MGSTNTYCVFCANRFYFLDGAEMNQTEQMRKHILDLLNAVSKACGDDEAQVKATIKSQGGDYKAIKQALAVEPAKLVRLTDEEIEAVCDAYGITKVMLAKGFANAIIDTLEAKNGGKP